MSKNLLGVLVAALIATGASTAYAQNIDLTGGNADAIWHGVEANANAGLWMDQGGVSAGDSRRDLIIGSPGGPGVLGRVYVINGGPTRTGNLSLANADAIITGASAGDLFGAQTAVGNVLNLENSVPRNLVIAAPNAMSGRGVVYLFAAGFPSSASQTTANAVFRVIGAPGDRLGTSLATADLNNDGRREIIIGAPGGDRIYIINGSASLSGTRDIETQGADFVIGGNGCGCLGNVMAAGDVTGDNISDLLVGAPDLSGIYLFRGNSGGTLTLDAHFSGTPGDRAGESVRLGDLDADGIRDVIIGAPNADGPGGARLDAGAAYVLWGSASLSTRPLANADVTFHGEVAGHRLGFFATSGDVNRDAPDDLLLLSPGASSGAGQLTVYYGRSRTSFGTNLGDGRRVIDFAAGGANRLILGDASTGVIRTAQVFEVTGEGARDIIVGVPGGQSNAGLVYFTVSPRLQLSTRSLLFRVDEGMAKSFTIGIANASGIAIAWSATDNRPWLTLSAAGGSTVNTAPGTLAVTASAIGMAPGTYTGTVTIRSTSEHLDMSLAVTATLVVRRRAVIGGDFSGDRAADMTVFRPSTGIWYQWHSGSGTVVGYQWGGGTDVPAAGDYDGDGRLDLAVFRPSNGVWYIWNSSDGTTVGIQWGNGQDRPVPADYDGDGRTDIAVFRPANGTWYIRFATGATAGVEWGNQLDVTVPADYDGDGKADIAVFRPGNGTWYVLYSGGGAVAVQWGNGNDIAVPGDYDGDGAVDIAVFRPSNGVWYVQQSSTGVATGFQWGNGNDKPVAGDYDGDGRTDFAVFRPANGVWYVWFSSTNSPAGFQWGNGSDIPVLVRP